MSRGLGDVYKRQMRWFLCPGTRTLSYVASCYFTRHRPTALMLFPPRLQSTAATELHLKSLMSDLTMCGYTPGGSWMRALRASSLHRHCRQCVRAVLKLKASITERLKALARITQRRKVKAVHKNDWLAGTHECCGASSTGHHSRRDFVELSQHGPRLASLEQAATAAWKAR